MRAPKKVIVRARQGKWAISDSFSSSPSTLSGRFEHNVCLGHSGPIDKCFTKRGVFVMADAPSPLSRRGFLAGLGATAATLAVPSGLIGPTPAAGADTAAGAHASTAALDLTDIQGNILAGFNKDFAAFVGVQFPSAAAGRAWLAALTPQIATVAEVSAFNAAFKGVNARAGSSPATLSATWLNVAFTFPGLRALAVPAGGLAQFPPEFASGMVARAAVLGDVGKSAPATWPAPLRPQSHAVVIIGADRSSDRATAISRQQQLAAAHGVKVLWVQNAAVRSDEPGFEHFGFRDGISQPGVRGYTPVSDPSNPNQGEPGQDLLWPGEFLLGYPRQAGAGKPITTPGPLAQGGPVWTKNGSFLVFRRLRQDVAGWSAFVAKTAKAAGVSLDLASAKLVGRYKSGAPLESTGNQAKDPGLSNPSWLTDANINNFGYSGDTSGKTVPFAAHIRKANPRDAPTDHGGLADTLTHRIIRRGIPFGTPLAPGTPPGDPANNPAYPNDRGLFFLCYQSSIARQFEFMQNHWANNPNFPNPGAGEDPISSQTTLPGSFTVPGNPAQHVELLARFVLTTGGDYYFQPAVSALHTLAQAH
jgi:Dyp-type peroxidase family